MTNYLLSIDPSIKNTGFTLWEKECELNCKYLWKPIESNTPHTNDIWKPIWINSYDFKKYSTKYEVSKSDAIYNNNFNFLIKLKIEKLIKCDIGSLFYNNNLNLIIERGTFHSKNGIGYETQEHLRGFIAGQFNKLITKDMLISPSEWKKWYVKIFWYAKDKIWNKELSIKLAKQVIQEQGWNITISNHDEADSLLIGWYYLNKEN
ncbi:hypothetical protein [Spiroplasma endosymbiont of Colias croceus]|uniref:hypothetical protein n=1 Tax=Spiroplasma endosymbiont of Colias croceus TaxID=3066310 RepID=UPI0030CF8302